MIKSGTQTFQFGDFVLDATNGELLRSGERVQVPPKVLETLIFLVERRGSVVSKNEMMAALWPNTFVEEANLTQNVFTLRRILGETNGTGFIETVPRRGYRFSADVRGPAAVTSEVVLQHDTRTSVVIEPARNALATALAIALGSTLLVTAIIAIGALVLRPRLNSMRRQRVVPPASSPQLTLKRLTYQGNVYNAGISPDGKYLAYNLRTDTEEGPKESLMLQNISTGSVVQVMPPAMPGYGSLTFSPDGNYLFYGSGREGVKHGIIFRVPVLGGTAYEVVANAWSAFALSPDGQQLAFMRGYATKDMPQALIVADVKDGKERELVVNRWQRHQWFNTYSSAPTWSPDGQSIAITGGIKDDQGLRGALFQVKVGDGTFTEIVTPRWAAIHQVVWLSDGKSLVASAQQKESDPVQLWRIAYPSGEVTRLTNDLSNYGRITVTGESTVIAAQQTTRVSHLWLLADGDSNKTRQLTSGSVTDGHSGLDLSVDGRVVFVSNRSGETDIWTVDADGKSVRQLTAKTGSRNSSPVHSADGRYLIFDSYRTGVSQIWRTDPNGNNPLQLTNSIASSPAVSPDSRWVYYTNWTYSPTVIEKISIDGGEPVRVTDGKYAAGSPCVSPDGKLLAHTYYDEEKGWHVAVSPVEGGDSIKLFDHAAQNLVRWMPDSQALIFIKPITGNLPGSNLWRQPIEGGPPTQLTHFGPKENSITNFAISPDGKRIVIARGRVTSDVVLLSNFSN